MHLHGFCVSELNIYVAYFCKDIHWLFIRTGNGIRMQDGEKLLVKNIALRSYKDAAAGVVNVPSLMNETVIQIAKNESTNKELY